MVTGQLRVGACLSLSGEYARFGTQAARALRVWQGLDGAVDLVLEDDESDPGRIEAVLPGVAARCDVLLGPYSSRLARAAARIAADAGLLLWNHGGAGDDTADAHPGHVVQVLTPASRYGEPFLHLLAASRPAAPLWITCGPGRFAHRAADGAQQAAARLGVRAVRANEPGALPDTALPDGTALSGWPALSDGPELSNGAAGAGVPGWSTEGWDLLTVGSFETDTEVVRRARRLRYPPRLICAAAAGVREFGTAAANPEGIYGTAQWFPGSGWKVQVGPDEPAFLRAYAAEAGPDPTPVPPDYPAVQAVAGAALAAHCARAAGGTTRDLLWAAAGGLDTMTVFGRFRIDPVTGAQTGHETVLLRWGPDGLAAA